MYDHRGTENTEVTEKKEGKEKCYDAPAEGIASPWVGVAGKKRVISYVVISKTCGRGSKRNGYELREQSEGRDSKLR
ncbi:MAG: hypothetical protein K0B81_06275 [Candidatus Cloacimonetes bacterium]|nr:hypothetical protein [Candidatus Cloacimonadota bacterium]